MMMDLRQACRKGFSVSKALQAFLILAVLLATQPGTNFALGHRSNSDHRITWFDDFSGPAFLAGRDGKNDKAQRPHQAFLGKIQRLSVVQRLSALPRKNLLRHDAPSLHSFKIRSPPVLRTYSSQFLKKY